MKLSEKIDLTENDNFLKKSSLLPSMNKLTLAALTSKDKKVQSIDWYFSLRSSTSKQNLMPERDRLSILIRNPTGSGGTLYVRGTSDSMKTVTNLDEKSRKYAKMVEFNAQHGYQTLVFASRKVSQYEAESFYRSYQAAVRSATDRDQLLLALADRMETNLTFEGAVGLLKRLRPHAADMVQQVKLMGVRTHMLSGDSVEACRRTAVALKLFPGNIQPTELNFGDVEGGRAQIKKVLELITTQMSVNKPVTGVNKLVAPQITRSDPELFRAKNLVLLISGSCIEVALKNRWVHEHLKLTFEFSSSIVGHEMTALQKGHVVSMLSELGRTTAAVGDVQNNLLMLKRASLGIQLLNSPSSFVFGDLTITSLSCIARCLNNRGRQFNNNLSLVVDAGYQHSLSMLALNVIHQIYCAASGVPILSSGYMLLLGVVLLPATLVFVFLGRTYNPGLRQKVPQLYAEHKAMNRQVFTKWFLQQIVPIGLTEGILIGGVFIQVLDNQVEREGTLANSNNLKLLLCATIVFLQCTKLVIFSQARRAIMLLILLVVILVEFALAGITQNRAALAVVFQLLKSPNQGALIVFGTSGLSLLYLAAWELSWSPSFHPIAEHLHRCTYPNIQKPKLRAASRAIEIAQPVTETAAVGYLRRSMIQVKNDAIAQTGMAINNLGMFDTASCDQLFGSLISTDGFSTMYKNCFDTDSEISEQVIKLLFPSDQTGNPDQALTKFLAFKSRAVAKKFAVFVSDKFHMTSRYTLWTICACFAVYLLVDGLLDSRKGSQTLWTRAIVFILAVMLHWLAFWPKFARKSAIYSVLLLGFLVVGSIFLSGLTRSDYSLAGVLILAYLSTQYAIGYRRFLGWCMVVITGLALGYAANYNSLTEVIVIQRPTGVPVLRIIALFVGILATYLLERYHNELLLKREFLSGSSLEGTNLFAKELLGLLLPKFILEEMDNPFEITTNPMVIDDGVNVSILFCDIAEFDEVVRLQENSIIGLLDGIFKKFDDLCTIHGVQKIETVGKTYMAAAGLKKVDDSLPFDLVRVHPTLRVLSLAKEMMAHIHEHTSLDLKIGIHFGKPVMGVIGFHKPQFSLIGDVVNTTSRHCTTGIKGRIMMSQAAWETVEYLQPLSQGYSSEVIPTEMKGKGSVLVYQLYRSKKQFVQRLENIIARKDELTDPEFAESLGKIDELVTYLKRARQRSIRFADIVLQVKPMDVLKAAFIMVGTLSANALPNLNPMDRVVTARFGTQQPSVNDSLLQEPEQDMSPFTPESKPRRLTDALRADVMTPAVGPRQQTSVPLPEQVATEDTEVSYD